MLIAKVVQIFECSLLFVIGSRNRHSKRCIFRVREKVLRPSNAKRFTNIQTIYIVRKTTSEYYK